MKGTGEEEWRAGAGAGQFLYGGDGQDTLIGGFAQQWLEGGAGNDSIEASLNSYDKTLNGGEGEDTLLGRRWLHGLDSLDGGAGH